MGVTSEIWIEPASAPITTDSRVRATFSCATTQIIRSDEVFNATLVGVGRFGIVYSYVLEVRPQFWVIDVVTKPSRTAIFNALRAGAAVPGRPFEALLTMLAADPVPPKMYEAAGNDKPYFFQLIFTTRNPPGIWVQRRWETSDQSDFNLTPPPNACGWLVGLGLNLLPNGLLDATVNQVFEDNFRASYAVGQRGRHAWITAGVPNGQFGDYRGVFVEVMFDANDPRYVDFLESVMNAGGNYRQAGWLSMRPSLATNATLSMHNVAGTHAVSIEVSLLEGMPDNENFLTFIQDTAFSMGGRLHWGQACNRLSASQVSLQYGAQLESWRRALWRVSGDSLVFSNNFTRQRGLEPLRDYGGLAITVPAVDELCVIRSGPLQSRNWSQQYGWTAWQRREMAVPQDGGPICAVSEGGRSHVFFIGSDGAVLFLKRQPNGTWANFWWYVTTTNPERPFLGVPGGAVFGLSSQPGSVHVLYANGSGNVISIRGDTNNGAWVQRDWVLQGRTSPGGWITGVSRRQGQIDIFTVGTDRQVYTAAWNAQQGWAGWWPIPGITAPPGAPIAAVSRRQDVLDIFVADDNGRTMSAGWALGGQWNGWWHIQQGMTSPGGSITAVSRAQDLIDIFTVRTDGKVYSAAWDPGNGWGGWWNLNNAEAQRIGAPIAAVSRSTNLLDIFYIDPFGVVQTMAWAPGQNWASPRALSQTQAGWRYCNKCQDLFFAPNEAAVALSRCSTGGTHASLAQSQSFNYSLSYGLPDGPGRQSGWRYCNKCQGLFFAPAEVDVSRSRCPAGGSHASLAQSRSFNYSLLFNQPEDRSRQNGWRYCNRCQSMFFAPNNSDVLASRCPAGGSHSSLTQSRSFNYQLLV